MKRKKNPGTLVKQKVIFHLFFPVHPAAVCLSGNIKKRRQSRGKSTLKHMRQSSESHKIDFDIKNVRVRLLIIHKKQFSFIPFRVPATNVECFVLCFYSLCFFGVEGSGQIEINLLLFPSNRLTSEIVLVDLSKTWDGGRGKRKWAKNLSGLNVMLLLCGLWCGIKWTYGWKGTVGVRLRSIIGHELGLEFRLFCGNLKIEGVG